MTEHKFLQENQGQEHDLPLIPHRHFFPSEMKMAEAEWETFGIQNSEPLLYCDLLGRASLVIE